MKTARNLGNKDSFSDVISTINLQILGWHLKYAGIYIRFTWIVLYRYTENK